MVEDKSTEETMDEIMKLSGFISENDTAVLVQRLLESKNLTLVPNIVIQVQKTKKADNFDEHVANKTTV